MKQTNKEMQEKRAAERKKELNNAHVAIDFDCSSINFHYDEILLKPSLGDLAFPSSIVTRMFLGIRIFRFAYDS